MNCPLRLLGGMALLTEPTLGAGDSDGRCEVLGNIQRQGKCQDGAQQSRAEGPRWGAMCRRLAWPGWGGGRGAWKQGPWEGTARQQHRQGVEGGWGVCGPLLPPEEAGPVTGFSCRPL